MSSKQAAFVFIRYRCSRHQAARNALSKWLSVHSNYTGSVAGVSPTVQCLEGTWPTELGVAVLSFESVDDAERWTHSTPEIKQQDWLDGVDMIIVPANDMPKKGFHYVQVLDLQFRDYEGFRENYEKDAREFLAASGASSAVVSTKTVKKVKGLWEPTYLVVNFWESSQQFEKAYNSEEYQKLKHKRCCYSECDMCIFQMDPLFCER